MGRVLVAFSGGVDSSYLALIANQELGEDALCVTGISPSVSREQREAAVGLAAEFGFNHRLIGTGEMDVPGYVSNPVDRCYFCKSELFGKLSDLARTAEIGFVLDGTNADDTGGHRPGMRAADENQVRSPLAEVGLGKDGIRRLSRRLGLPTWDRPASPCLASRIAYGVPVSIERLSRIERGERFLRSLGFVEFRVRVHDDIARIEIARGEMRKILDEEVIAEVASAFRRIGFSFTTLDLAGFRSGSLNTFMTISTQPKGGETN